MRQLSAISMVYQAQRLVARLESLPATEYPREAIRLSELIASFGEHIAFELQELALEARNNALSEVGYARARELSSIVASLYTFVRYIRAAGTRQAPPSVQSIIAGLATEYFPRPGPIILIRPQWAYNLKYVPIKSLLRQLVDPVALDPLDRLGILANSAGANDLEIAESFLTRFWRDRRARLKAAQRLDLRKEMQEDAPPLDAAVLSFAGLDRDVPFQFPILAHELGHFVDSSGMPEHHQDERIRRAALIRREQVSELCEANGIGQKDKIEEFWKSLTRRAESCLKEILADVLATRMLGLGFALAQADFLRRSTTPNHGDLVTPAGYPSLEFRLHIILTELMDMDGARPIERFLESSPISGEEKQLAEWTARLVDRLRTELGEHINRIEETKPSKSALLARLTILAGDTVVNALPAVRAVARELIPEGKTGKLTHGFFERVRSLCEDLPPSISGDSSAHFAEIMSASWVYRLRYGLDREFASVEAAKKYNEFGKCCRLVQKAVELAAAASGGARIWDTDQAVPPHAPVEQATAAEQNRAGVLGSSELIDRLSRPAGDSNRIVITPNRLTAVQGASVDVTLGQWFKIARRPLIPSIDLTSKEKQVRATEIAHDELFVPFGEKLVIHAGAFVLGITLEFIALPGNVMAFVEGKSRLGRTGLIVATATQVAPGFHGCVVLELANTGSVPLTVEPGISVAQLVLLNVSGDATPYDGSSQCQIKP